jgi:TolB-like protein
LADVFISYARSDQAAAARLARGLQAAGFEVWWDAELPAHRAYSEVIERNLDQAKAVVVLWSKAAAASQWVRAEADFARNAGKLVQGSADATIPPMPFNQIQCADLKGWRGNAKHGGWSKLRDSVRALVSGQESPAAKLAEPSLWNRIGTQRLAIAAILTVVLAAFGLFLFIEHNSEDRKPVLAVLPFRTLDSHDDSLVAGIWEDTRQLIGRNPQLIVLGPNTAQQLAQKGEGAASKAADYLLQASVRTAGDHIRVSADLVRTKDGEQVWTQDFDRKLDDVFALQSEMAKEIEGRVRGRLAEKGGIMPEHIATSGEVYALYSDARAKIRKRGFSDDVVAARLELLQVVKLDPNFAPAWAALAEVDRFIVPSQKNWSTIENSERYARKAIDLAPNLAAGHAALAFALNLTGPVARAEIQRAVQLDPNDFEAVTWLGNTLVNAGDKKGALDAYSRAVQIEPLFWPAVLNKYSTLKDLGDEAGIAALIDQEQRIGGDYLATSIRADQAYAKGNLAEAVNLGLQYWATGKKEGRTAIGITLDPALLQLGFIDEVSGMGAPDLAPFLWRDDPKGLDMLESHHMPPRTFFSIQPLAENAGRVYLLSGRGKTLSDMYLSLKVSAEDFASLAEGDGPEHFLYMAPLLATALRQNGHAQDANALLSLAESKAKEHDSPTPLQAVLLARIYAADDRREDAIPLLGGAIRRGWLPALPELQVDLHADPALAGLKGDPRFEKLRDQILGTIARERAQVNLGLVHQVAVKAADQR